MSDYLSSEATTNPVRFFTPAVSDWARPLGLNQPEELRPWNTRKAVQARPEFWRAEPGLYENAAFAALALSGAATILIALV